LTIGKTIISPAAVVVSETVEVVPDDQELFANPLTAKLGAAAAGFPAPNSNMFADELAETISATATSATHNEKYLRIRIVSNKRRHQWRSLNYS
jgi:hypothetical protein